MICITRTYFQNPKHSKSYELRIPFLPMVHLNILVHNIARFQVHSTKRIKIFALLAFLVKACDVFILGISKVFHVPDGPEQSPEPELGTNM